MVLSAQSVKFTLNLEFLFKFVIQLGISILRIILINLGEGLLWCHPREREVEIDLITICISSPDKWGLYMKI